MGEEELYETQPSPVEEERADREHGPLVDRLRGLEWPPVEPEVRERSWERFKKLMELDDARRSDGTGP